MVIILQTVVRINLKMIQMKLFTNRNTLTDFKNKLTVTKRDRLAVWD